MKSEEFAARAEAREAGYITRRHYRGDDREGGGFFDMLFKQLLATMIALTLLFCCNLIPVTRGYIEQVKEVVSSDYTEDVLAVFGEH